MLLGVYLRGGINNMPTRAWSTLAIWEGDLKCVSNAIFSETEKNDFGLMHIYRQVIVNDV
jgi:hypothetical protein